jgi:Cd2+/Zn2+-exporting ATPase
MAASVFILQGLCCANCAKKIEDNVKTLNGVSGVNLSFATQELSFDITDANASAKIADEIKKIVGRIEPKVVVIGKNKMPSADAGHTQADEHSHDRGGKIAKASLATLVVGVCVYIAAFIFPVDNGTLRLIMFLAAYLLLGWDVVYTAVRNLFHGDLFDENFLMSVSTAGAFCIREYPEAVAVMLFYKVGEYFQEKAAGKSRASIKSLLNLKPDHANILENGEIRRVDPNGVSAGQTIVVLPGEKIPLDGVVLEGSSSVDCSPITGESLPVEVSEGSELQNGTLNLNGKLILRTTKDYSDSTITKILRLVEEAAAQKAPAERFITRFSRVYTPTVVFMAALLAFIPPILGFGAFSDWISRALIFLVVSCPCALVISVPLTFFAGIGAAARRGVLIKGGGALQALNGIDTFVFDKTGTLTIGEFEVSELKPANGASENELLSTACAVERYSNHPLAKALINEYSRCRLNSAAMAVTGMAELPGYGLSAIINGEKAFCGNNRLMLREGFNGAEHGGNGSIMHVALGGRYIGYIRVTDRVRGEAKAVIDAIKRLGIRDVVMLTGDRKPSAEKTASEIGITSYAAELLPQQKLEYIERLYSENKGRKIAFIGDGINDAPVLARCDAGFAMGGVGSDAAIEAADIVVLNDDLRQVPEAIAVSRMTMRIIRQNVALALICKFAVLALGAFGLAAMWMAVFADVGVCLIVVLNSVRASAERVQKIKP